MEVKKNCPPLPPRPITPARTYPVLSAVEIAAVIEKNCGSFQAERHGKGRGQRSAAPGGDGIPDDGVPGGCADGAGQPLPAHGRGKRHCLLCYRKAAPLYQGARCTDDSGQAEGRGELI